MARKNFQFIRRIITVIVVSGLASAVCAAPADRPPEKNSAYEFNGKDMQGYGAGINADTFLLGGLFGDVLNSDVLRKRQAAVEKKGWLGIAMIIPAQLPKEPDTGKELSAIEVTRIVPQSAAEAAGLREGDLIVGLDGKPVESEHIKTLFAFGGAISGKRPGDKAKLRILRDGALLDIEATISSYPRVKSVLKSHPDPAKKQREKNNSLLKDALEKEQLKDEFARTLLEIRSETDKVDSPQIRPDGYHPFRLQEVNYVMYNPLDLPVVARKVTGRLHGDVGKTHHDLAALVRTAMGELDMAGIPAKRGTKKPPADMDEYLVRLVEAVRHANSERAAVLSVLSDWEIDFLYATAPKLLAKNPDDEKREVAAPDREKTAEEKEQAEVEERKADASLLRFFQIVLKLDTARLLNASAEIAQALDMETFAALDKKSGKLKHYPDDWAVREEDNLTVIDTPAGRVLIGGDKDNTYTDDAALILDFGGNDQYPGSAGGSTRANPFSISIDLSGNDSYSAADDFAQGAGLVGGGFMVDLEGDDRYTAKNYSQGAGILGVGMLVDLAGNDHYTAVSAGQGAGSFGIGLLAEGGGDDSYSGSRYVQGFGHVNGFGAIVEAAGNDNYFAGGKYEDFRAPGKSYQSLSQGFGYGMRPREFVSASGGIGLIAEAEGNDTYVADYFAQGSSYWFALGILDDRKGHDRYISGRYSQGAGIHLSAGVLIDGEGDDNYLADFGVAQGCGHDYGIGFLLDNGGNDRYTAGVIAQGAGNDSGIGVLSDNGGNDEYYLRSIGQGSGNFDPFRDVGSFGFLFDTGGGTDIYTQGTGNNSLSYKTRWGILLDTN